LHLNGEILYNLDMVIRTTDSGTKPLESNGLTDTFFLAAWFKENFGIEPMVSPKTDFAVASPNIPASNHEMSDGACYYDPQVPYVREERVVDLQGKLRAFGDECKHHIDSTGGRDGKFGPGTQSSVEIFQAKFHDELTARFGSYQKGVMTSEMFDFVDEKFDALPPAAKVQTSPVHIDLTSANSLYGRSDLPRGIRNNNPGNLDHHASNPWQGQIGVEAQGRHATFETPQHGIRAMTKLIQNYDTKYGLDTLSGIINRYAPTSENNTRGYINAIARNTGIPPNAKLDLHDPATIQKLIPAMIHHENGMNPYSTEVINEGLKLAGVNPDPVFAQNQDAITLPSSTMKLTNS